MKMIIERNDLLAILNTHFGEEFDVENVEMPEEFEIVVKGIPLPASERRARAPAEGPRARPTPTITTTPSLPSAPSISPEEEELVAARADADASTEPPPPGNDETDFVDVSGSPASVLQQSRELQAQLARGLPGPRRKGGQSNPPPFTREEA